jgi:hypothetical protein
MKRRKRRRREKRGFLGDSLRAVPHPVLQDLSSLMMERSVASEEEQREDFLW